MLNFNQKKGGSERWRDRLRGEREIVRQREGQTEKERDRGEERGRERQRK